MPANRRQLLQALAALGVGTATFRRAVAAQAEKAAVTPEMIKNAEWVAGITLTDDERKAVAGAVGRSVRQVETLRKIGLPNSVPPATAFVPNPCDRPVPAARTPVEAPAVEVTRPDNADDLAFLPLAKLAALLRGKRVSSVELTKLYLDRLKKYDPALKCVVSLTEELALKQARQADEEIAAGKYRGPLHGVPWGAKDLIAYPGYKTTWGAGHFKEQTLDEKATVARRLDDAGAVLVAKLTLGALAMGDQWFGGMTRNPWHPKQGSSGSSAGSAAAAAAGLVGFAVGSETLGSIVSPCTRCGASGLRPTFGRVSRHGCMTLSWTMDKIGPICRTIEDCALVFASLLGSDGKDATVQDRPFDWPCPKRLKDLRVGYVENPRKAVAERDELKVLRDLGVKLVPITLPADPPAAALRFILTAEAGAAFDDLTRAGVRDGIGAWATTFREARFISAVDYLRAQRVRTLLMKKMDEAIKEVDLYVSGNDLLVTNLTGHPTAVLPNGFTTSDKVEVPTAITFTGRLFGESELLAVAQAYQEATGHHRKRPPQDKWVAGDVKS